MDDNSNLVEILQNEKFVAFFDFYLPGENGRSELDGLCKVAVAQHSGYNDYVSLTFIFDTPSETKYILAKRILSKLTPETFKRVEPSVYAVTSVPGTLRPSENYIHNVDIMFRSPIANEIKNIVNKIAFAMRSYAALDTEVPQWWDEDSAPAPTEAEKANWASRIKALLSIMRK